MARVMSSSEAMTLFQLPLASLFPPSLLNKELCSLSAFSFLPFTPFLMLFLQGCEHFFSRGKAVPSGVCHRGHKGIVSSIWLPN